MDYSESDGEGHSSSTSMGFSIGATMEVDGKVSIFGINLGRVYSATTLTSNFDWRMSNSDELWKIKTFNCNGGNDRVIFTCIAMDVYTYTIVKNPDDPSAEGKTLTISIPRDFSFENVPLDFYNDNNGELPNVSMPHTPGDVSTYPTEPPQGALSSSHALSFATIAGGTDNLEIAVTTTTADEFAVEMSLEQSIGAGSGPLTVMVNLGFHTSYSYESSISEGTIFTGTVGFIPEEYVANPAYDYNVGLYAAQTDDQFPHWEVEYWTD